MIYKKSYVDKKRFLNFIYAFLFVLLFFFNLKAQVKSIYKIIPISHAKALASNPNSSKQNNKKVTVAGRVTIPTNLLNSKQLEIYIQDQTGGIFLYSKKPNHKLSVGDSVIVTGLVSTYLKQIELDDPEIRIIKCPPKNVHPNEVVLTLSDVKNYEGMLIKTKVRIINAKYNSGGELLEAIESKGGDFIITIFYSRYAENKNILADIKVGDVISVTGVLGRYDYDNVKDAGYEIYPRDKSDIKIISRGSIFTTNNILIASFILIVILLWIVSLQLQVKRKSNSLKESEEKFRMLAETTSSAIIIYNEAGLLYANPVTASILGYTVDELKKMNLPSYMFPHNHEDAKKQNGKNSVAMHEVQIQTKFNRIKWIYYSAVPIRFESKNAFLGTAVDITRIKQIENELIIAKEKADEMNRIKSSFLASMSHELRTPMNGILGFAAILAGELENEEYRYMAQSIFRSSNRLMSTLNQILDLARVESNKQEIDLLVTNAAEKILETVELFLHDAKNKNLSLETDFEEQNIFALLDDSLITQVLNNLVHNAIKFTEKGSVTVQLRRLVEDGIEKVNINVIDTGIGIPEEYADTIFEEFRQASEGWARKFEGTGLGLTLTKKFVELMNGKIKLKSKPGVGSTFSITFPSVKQNEDKKSNITITDEVPAAKIQIGSLPSILLVEDDEASALITKLFLKNLCEIDNVDTGEKAILKASEKSYDAIFMDINMKGIGGVVAAKRIKVLNNYKEVPIVAFTAYAMVGDKEKFLSNGFDYYLSKPFTKEELLNLFNSIFNS